MSLDKIIKNLDVSKVKAPSGVTFGEELVAAANLLRDCIQKRINRETMGNVLTTADIADIQVDEQSLLITLKIQNSSRQSIFNESNHKYANVFWLLNDGFSVKRHWHFDGFAHKERWIYRKAEHFVEEGIADFNGKTKLPVKIKLIKRPHLYYWEE